MKKRINFESLCLNARKNSLMKKDSNSMPIYIG